MKNKFFITIGFLLFSTFIYGQSASDCPDGDNGCSFVTNGFPITPSGFGLVDELAGNNISNPTTNPNAAPGNAGCLLSGELNSTWITVYVQQSGTLEFSFDNNTGNGLMDWAMWDNSNGNACTDIAANTLPPVACNWNLTSAGLTGMADPLNLPVGANPGNFENPINVTSGQSFTIMFSNFSALTTTVNLSFFGSAVLGCDPIVPKNITKCLNLPLSVDYSLQLPANVASGIAVPATNITVNPPLVTFSTNVNQAYEIIWTSPDSTWSDSAYISVQTPLLPTFAGLDDTTCLGDSIQLSPTLGNTSSRFIWSVSNSPGLLTFSPLVTDLNPYIGTITPGTYEVVLTESDTNNICPDVTDTANFIFSEEIHTVSFINPSCHGFSDGSITINSLGTLGAVEYSIDNGFSWSPNNIFNNLPFGVYDVISRDISGCTFESEVTLLDPDKITLTVSNDTTVCENGTASLVAVSTNANTFNWDFIASTAGNQFISVMGDSTVVVYATDANNCSSDTLSINMYLYDPINISISGDQTICPQDEAVKVVSATGGYEHYNYAWTANGSSAAFASSQINVNPAIETEYCVTVTDQCESTAKSLCSKVFMFPVPVPDFTSEIIENCEPNGTIGFTVTTDDALFKNASVTINGISYNLSNDPLNPSLKSDTAVIAVAGSYDFSLSVVSDNGCESSITLADYITIDPIPLADFYITPERATIYEPYFEITNLSEGNDITFDWEIKGGSPSVSKEENPSLTFPQFESKEYPVSLLVTSADGCINTASGLAIVENDVIIYAPNSFTPDDDQHNNTWRVHILGIDQYDFRLQVFSRWGELVFESRDPNEGWDGTWLNGNAISPGTYVWVIETTDQSTSEVVDFRGTVNVFR